MLRAWPLTVFIGVPVALIAIWLLRAEPPEVGCGDVVTHAIAVSREAWLSGARVIFPAAALLVLGAILQVSSWRRGGQPGTATIVICATLAAYVVATAIATELFVALGIVAVLTIVGFWVTIPLICIAIIVYLVRRPRPARPLAALAVTGWCSLLLGVGSIAMDVVLQGSDTPICWS